MDKGKFIVIEGLDLSGKDTQIDLLKRYLSKTNDKVAVVSNVSSSPIGKTIRTLLSTPEIYISSRQMACIFISELHIVAKDIERLLVEGFTVICSRWFYSTLAYAGKERTVYNSIKEMSKVCVEPDIVIFLDITPDIALSRLNSRGTESDVYENIDKLTSVYNMYKTVIVEYKNKFIVIDANQPFDKVHKDIITTLEI